MILVKILVFILVLSIIICIHELGHFFTAKKFGILCHEFSIGMGPAIYKKKKGETTYAIRAIPIGGYVSMAGEQFTEDVIKVGDSVGLNIENNQVYEIILDRDTLCDVRGRIIKREIYSRHGEPLEIELCLDDSIPDAELSNTKGVSYSIKEDAFFVEGKNRLQLAPFNRCLESKPIWQRFITMFAGAFMNFVLAMFIYLICHIAQGTPMYKSTTIGSVSDDFPAYSILEKGDKILKVNGNDVTTWYEFQDEMENSLNNGILDVNIVVKRKNNEIVSKTINANVYINSIGLSNAISSDSKYYNAEMLSSGAVVGDYGLRYKTKVSDSDNQISTGDIITAINITPYKEDFSEDNWVVVSSWSDLVLNLKDIDVCDIYFEYLDVEENDGKLTYTKRNTYEDSQRVQSYGNEVLDSQNVDKIKIIIGVSPRYYHNIFESIGAAFKNFWTDFTLIFSTLKLIIHPTGVRQVGVQNLSGVVGIYSMIGQYLSAGIIALLLFMALLSVNIGVVNLLPIPALDGGRILFILIEGITHKPLNRKIEAMINNIMFILLMIFMVYILYNDIMRLI